MTVAPTDEQRSEDPEFFDKAFNLVDIISAQLAPRISLEQAHILDFGCGFGETALGFALRYPKAKLVGMDLTTDVEGLRRRHQTNMGAAALPENLLLRSIAPGEFPDFGSKFSAIYSWSVIEHVRMDLLPAVLSQLREALSDSGFMLIQIAPLYYSAFGHHVSWTPDFAWAHLTAQSDQFDAQLVNFAETPEKTAELRSTYLTLNRLTAEELRHVLEDAGFFVEWQYRSNFTEAKPARTAYAFRSDVLDTEQVLLICSKAKPKGFADSLSRLTRGDWRHFAKTIGNLPGDIPSPSVVVEQCASSFGSLHDYSIFEAFSGDGENTLGFERSGGYVLAVEPDKAAFCAGIVRRNLSDMASKFICGDPFEILSSTNCRFDLVVLHGCTWEQSRLQTFLDLATDRTDRIYASVETQWAPWVVDQLKSAGFRLSEIQTAPIFRLAAKRSLNVEMGA